jgi:hypothetical protein
MLGPIKEAVGDVKIVKSLFYCELVKNLKEHGRPGERTTK